jgi:hypothetical protein
MKRGHIAAVVAEASHPAPGRAVTADPAVLAARTITGVDTGAARRAAADFLSALSIDVDREEMRETPPGWPAPTPSCSARRRCG